MVGLREANQELNGGILERRGLTLKQVYDETEYIESALTLAEKDVYIGGLLTVGALLIFLRSIRSTLIIAIAIPTTLLGCFIALKILGRTFNVLSLAGLAFAVGMFVDNFIVVLENIFRHYQMGEDRITAAVKGTREVWGAVLSATIANMGVFVPVLLVQGEAGQLFRDIAIAVSAGLVLSLFVALCMIPTATSRILQHENAGPRFAPGSGHGDGSHRAPHRRGARSSRRRGVLGLIAYPFVLMGRYIGSLLDGFGAAFVRAVVGINAWAQRSLVRALAVVLLLVGLSLAGSYVLLPGVEYLPQGNRNLTFGILLPPPGYNLDQLTAMGEEIEARTGTSIHPIPCRRITRASVIFSMSPADAVCSLACGRMTQPRLLEWCPSSRRSCAAFPAPSASSSSRASSSRD
jgi:HAE1 family hydrophobic/amphiphilic exporter-1